MNTVRLTIFQLRVVTKLIIIVDYILEENCLQIDSYITRSALDDTSRNPVPTVEAPIPLYCIQAYLSKNAQVVIDGTQ